MYNLIFMLALLIYASDVNCLLTPIDDHIRSMEKLSGEDVCSGCDEQLCNTEAACGYVQVKFRSMHLITVYDMHDE